jgi:hypothetical protein
MLHWLALNRNKSDFYLPKQNKQGLWKRLEVIVAMYGGIVINCNATKNLHANYCIDEEQHNDQQCYIWQGLKYRHSNFERGNGSCMF